VRHDPLMKLAVGRCPESGAALASQSTISRLENAPSKTEAARLAAALLDQFGTTAKPGRPEIFDIDDTFCAADEPRGEMPRRASDDARSTPNALHGEFTLTDPDGRTDGVRAPAQRAKKRGVVHDCG